MKRDLAQPIAPLPVIVRQRQGDRGRAIALADGDEMLGRHPFLDEAGSRTIPVVRGARWIEAAGVNFIFLQTVKASVGFGVRWQYQSM